MLRRGGAKSRVERYFPCRNLADNPTEQFHLAPEDYVAAAEWGTITLIVHSHPDATTQPSELDKAQCDAMELPWAIASWPEEICAPSCRAANCRWWAASSCWGIPIVGVGHELLPAGARPGVARLSG